MIPVVMNQTKCCMLVTFRINVVGLAFDTNVATLLKLAEHQFGKRFVVITIFESIKA